VAPEHGNNPVSSVRFRANPLDVFHASNPRLGPGVGKGIADTPPHVLPNSHHFAEPFEKWFLACLGQRQGMVTACLNIRTSAS
jgi:hypothetical protein